MPEDGSWCCTGVDELLLRRAAEETDAAVVIAASA